MEDILSAISDFEGKFEGHFQGVPRWQLILGTISLAYGGFRLYDVIGERHDIVSKAWDHIFKILTKIPMVKNKIKEELDTVKEDVKKTFNESIEGDMEQFEKLPKSGKSAEEILECAKSVFKLGRFDWQKGRMSGGVMAGSNDSHSDLVMAVYHTFSWTNPLHADIFPGVRKMEAEIVRMTADIFHGDEDTAGCVTSGGTESLLMAMKAYRDWGRVVRGINKPEIVAAVTAHPGFDKGCDIMGMKFRKIAVDPETWKVKIADVEKAISRNTVMIVASAPEYAHGIIDDIETLSQVALKHRIPLHVDACLGGFILPFMDAAGYPLPLFDFRLQGVTSISADTHKYGNTPKGTSVILYRNKEYRKHQYFVTPDWPGGIYATPTIPGSRPGAHIAMCWAAMLSFGFDGYVRVTKDIIKVARTIKKKITNIDGLFIIGDPMGPVVSFGSNKFNILQVADVMGELGWHLQPLQNPSSMHIFLTSLHTAKGTAKAFLDDLEKAVKTVKSAGSDNKEGWAKIYGTMNSVPHKSIIEDVTKFYLDAYYSLPEK